MNSFVQSIESSGVWAPWLFAALFLASSFLMIWRLEAMNAGGLEGTVLGTLVTPYCTGLGNLMVAFIVGRDHGNGADVMINSLVNNITNMTLLIGLPAIFWNLSVLPAGGAAAAGKGKKKKNGKSGGAGREHEINRLSLLLTLTAVFVFTGAVWWLGRKGTLNRSDGFILVAFFLFWQAFHVFDVLKSNIQKNKSLSWFLWVEFALIIASAYAQYISLDWLSKWLEHRHAGFFSMKNFGWLTGWLTVLPNGILAIYYAWRGKPEIVYTSQVGDNHVSIPLCVGVFALYETFRMPGIFETGMWILFGATIVHFFFIAVLGRLPRVIGLGLVGAYGWFVYNGLFK